jgi:hypothetical protein
MLGRRQATKPTAWRPEKIGYDMDRQTRRIAALRVLAGVSCFYGVAQGIDQLLDARVLHLHRSLVDDQP